MSCSVRMEAIGSMVPLATVTRDASTLRLKHFISVEHAGLYTRSIANSMTTVMLFQRKPKLAPPAELDAAPRGDCTYILD